MEKNKFNEIIEQLSGYLDNTVYTKKCVETHSMAIRALRELQYSKDDAIIYSPHKYIEDELCEKYSCIKYNVKVVISQKTYSTMKDETLSHIVCFPNGVQAKILIFDDETSFVTWSDKNGNSINVVPSMHWGVGDFFDDLGKQYWFENENIIYNVVMKVDTKEDYDEESFVETPSIHCYC